MTKAQALALMNALESQFVPADAQMRFPSGQPESWQVEILSTYPVTGAQLAQLTSYCATNGLTLTAEFATLGIT